MAGADPVYSRRTLAILATAIAFIATAFVAITPGRAAASPFGLPAGATMHGENCSDWWTWQGGWDYEVQGVMYQRPFGPEYGPHGRVKFCWIKYKYTNETVADYDYYGIGVQMIWDQQGGDTYKAAKTAVMVFSNVAVVSSWHTPTFTADRDCSQSFEVGISGGAPFIGASIATDVQVCRDTSVYLDGGDPTGDIYAAGRCTTCVLQQRLCLALSGPSGTVRNELVP